jgi:DNA (cytosine-5)-methyltransferase 1
MFTSIEVCAGAGGQAIGLEMAGFEHKVLVEIDSHACQTLRLNRPNWAVLEKDLREFSAAWYNGIDLLSGGVPCPPFSIAGKQLGQFDERDLFPEILRLTRECNPKAILIENVKGLLSPKFKEYRFYIQKSLAQLGYYNEWKLLNASSFGVPQLRPRAILVGLKAPFAEFFIWPERTSTPAKTVGDALYKFMAVNGWEGADDWRLRADTIAPTLVGGSKKHGGPDLGPSRARSAWRQLGVNGGSIAEEPPLAGFCGDPRLTVKMASIVQGFPEEWTFYGKKTAAYRQVGNAFPPPVAKAIGSAIKSALSLKRPSDKSYIYSDSLINMCISPSFIH